jgi:hypothetical protein
VLDQLANLNLQVSTMTPIEVRRAAARLAPTSSVPMGQLGTIVDEVVYSAPTVTEEVARAAWVASRDASRAIRQALPWKRRLRAFLRPVRRGRDRADLKV